MQMPCPDVQILGSVHAKSLWSMIYPVKHVRSAYTKLNR